MAALLVARVPKRKLQQLAFMHDTRTQNSFIELRARGWSLRRISAELKVAPRTLVDWNRKNLEAIRTLRALELEALREKVLATHEQELLSLKTSLDQIEAQISTRSYKFVELQTLHRLAALVRAKIRKACAAADSDLAILSHPRTPVAPPTHAPDGPPDPAPPSPPTTESLS